MSGKVKDFGQIRYLIVQDVLDVLNVPARSKLNEPDAQPKECYESDLTITRGQNISKEDVQ